MSTSCTTSTTMSISTSSTLANSLSSKTVFPLNQIGSPQFVALNGNGTPISLDFLHHKYGRPSSGAANSSRYFLFQSPHVKPLIDVNVKNSDKYCQYMHRHCLQEKLEGYSYCKQHILQDKTAPFKQCSYIHRATGKRCPNVERRPSGTNELHAKMIYCSEHNKKINLLNFKTQLMASVTQSGGDAFNQREALKRRFSELEHYCGSEHDHRRANLDWQIDSNNVVLPSKQLKRKIDHSLLEIQSRIVQEEECPNVTMGEVLNLDNIETDFEGPETYMENPLRHASVYTAEEVGHILRDKLLRLQTLYINQLGYYRHMLKIKMTDYLLEAKKDKNNDDKLLSAAVAKNPFINALKEVQDLNKLKAMQKYHNAKGNERLVKEQAAELRLMALDKGNGQQIVNSKEPRPTCIFPLDDKDTCTNVCLPLSNYCLQHILYDDKQVLFRPCAGGPATELPCSNPVISYIHKNTCLIHSDIRQSKEEVDNILPNPVKNETVLDDVSNVLAMPNETELFPPMDELDNVNFSLDTFDLGGEDMLV